MSRHVTVAGGGIAGLAAALRLADAGVRVTVVEAGDRLGGKLHTSPFAGRMVDEGADAFLVRVPWALDLCRRLDLTGELVHPVQRTAYVYSGGELRPLPPQLLGVPTDLDALARSGLVSGDGLARAAEDLERPATPPGPADEAVGSVIHRRLGTEVLDRMVDPLVGGINAGDTRRLSLAAVTPQLDAAARDRHHASLIEACRAQQSRARAAPPGAGKGEDPPIFAAPESGMARLVDATATALAVTGQADARLGRRAVAVEPAPGGGGWLSHLDDGATVPSDGVVLALPAPALTPLLQPLAPEAAGHLAAIEHASVALVTLAVGPADLGRPLDASGYLVPRAEGTALTACSWTSSKWAHLGAGEDRPAVLRASAGRAGDQAALDLDDGDLVERILGDLDRTMGLAAVPAAVRVSRWHDGFPQYAPGHLDRIAEVEADLAHHAPGLVLAGAALRGVGVPACVNSGQQAADRLLAVTAGEG